MQRIKPIIPTRADWEKLAEFSTKSDSRSKNIDVIVPVYKGMEETMRCLYSVCSAKQKTVFDVVVINDRSPDPELVKQLNYVADLGFIDLHHNAENLGFVGTVNYGMQLHPDRDVVLLNSDTEVYNDWLDRIYRFAQSDPAIGTVTPLSNNAEICSYPVFVQDNNFELEVDGCTIDRIAKKVNEGCSANAPTGVGFCMFIKRECLSAVGYFDVETFGRGYGEENDFCQRAIENGFRNAILADTYVRHYGSTSFGADKMQLVRTATAAIQKKHPNYLSDVGEFISKDVLKEFRRNIDIERLKTHRNGKLICFISHNLGGGTERHVLDLKKQLEGDDEAKVLVLRPQPGDSSALIVDDSGFPNVGPFRIDGDATDFSRFLIDAGVDLVHIHSLVGASPELSDYLRVSCRAAGVGYDFTVHDYFTVCPRFHLIDYCGQYCCEPDISACEECCSSGGYLHSIGGTSVWAWRD
ncbi:hypothetical protein BR10RB9215_C10242 [Brucella sp. 10RB9215]|uniref:glycosyltransferase n=1 Tax=Brucella sp. 10RB9215 TaxID=1149953 RepID=UPI00090A005F|nr:glycosyltransferase [Brucella sp. 10RB9215]SBW13437.1 hypothetical protein BR10RB9215_C10242 [Brucella sp. 10RB9215]